MWRKKCDQPGRRAVTLFGLRAQLPLERCVNSQQPSADRCMWSRHNTPVSHTRYAVLCDCCCAERGRHNTLHCRHTQYSLCKPVLTRWLRAAHSDSSMKQAGLLNYSVCTSQWFGVVRVWAGKCWQYRHSEHQLSRHTHATPHNITSHPTSKSLPLVCDKTAHYATHNI